MSKPKSNRGSDMKDEAMYLVAGLLAVGMFQIHSTMKRHIDDCSKKSALVAKVLIGVAVMVFGELIMKGLSLFHLATAVAGSN